MGAKWKTTKNEFPSMVKAIEGMNGKKVKVGCISGQHQWLAAIHEYGCNINVTPKMRKYLHSKGLHLSPSTTVIKIPERSFLRTGHDENIKDVLKKADMAIPLVIEGKMSEEKLFDLVGQLLSSKIKDYATSLSSPPNHDFTISQKKSSNPLVDTGQMIEGITWKTE